jgi:hypothetical protein
MNSPLTEHHEIVQQVETLKCDRCRKKWQVGWVEAVGIDSVEHALTCDCGRMLKVVQVAGDDPPLMILQHCHWKTVVACLPAVAGGALFPVLSEPVLLTLYVIAWIACAATFINDDNSDFSALIGIAIWSMAIISAAAALGALLAHALWWW